MRKNMSMIASPLILFFFLLLFHTTARAEKRAYLYTGDILVLDTVNDTILATARLPADMKWVYGIKAFPKANAVFIMGEYKVYTLDLETMKLLNESGISSQYEHVSFILSPDENDFYVIWLPYNDIADWTLGAKRKITQFDTNLLAREINDIELSDRVKLIDFSLDGTKFYATVSGKPGKVQVLDAKSWKVMNEINYDEIGRKTVFNKIVEDIKNNKILFLEIEKKGGGVYTYYTYDVDEGKTSTAITSSKRLMCNLIATGDKLICDEIDKSRGSSVPSGKLHLYDSQSGIEIRSLDLSSEADLVNNLESKVVGITPDGTKAYYRTRNGLAVIDVNRFKVLKTLNIKGSFMSFAGY